MEDKKLDIIFNFRKRKSIPIYVLFACYLFISFRYIKQEAITAERLLTSIGFLFLWIAIMLFALTEMSPVRSFFKKYVIWINAFVLLLAPVVSFLMVEVMVSNYNLPMFENYGLYNIVWYIIIYYLIFSLIRNSKLTVIIGILLIYLAGTVNYLVYLFRGNPLLPSDILAWQTGMSVASNYELKFTMGFLLATVIMFLYFVLGMKLETKDRAPSMINRAAVAVTFVIFATSLFHMFFGTDLVKTKIRVIDFFAPKYTYSAYGTAFGFVANAQAMETEKPKGYSVQKVEDTVNKAQDLDKNYSDQGEKPNIIVIMNESYSDLSFLGDFKTNMEYRPYTKSLTKNTIHGKLYVSVFGGATSDTEYEFLTGNSMAILPQNCVPYQQYVTNPTDSLATTLKAQGYYNIAIHPYEPSGYKRDMVYPLLGFDEFLSMKDFTNPEYIRSFIDDRTSFQKVIEEYENKGKNGPVFIFNVTMQDHGGYSSDQIFSDDETVKLINQPGHGAVEQYLSLLRQSDMAFETLVDYFKKQKKHTIILMFGDHQPVVYQDFLNPNSNQPEDYKQKYQVPYVLWTNYDISEEGVDEISANYLSSYLLKIAGLKGTSYNHYLMKLREKIPVMNALFYIDNQNLLHGYSDDTKYSEFINNYKYVGYNDAFDQKGKLKHLFYLK